MGDCMGEEPSTCYLKKGIIQSKVTVFKKLILNFYCLNLNINLHTGI